MRSSIVITLIGILFVLSTDTALYFSLKTYFRKRWQKILYWVHSGLFIALLLVYHFAVPRLQGPEAYRWIGTMIGTLSLFYTPKLLFLIFNSIGWIMGRFIRKIWYFFRILGTVIAILVFALIFYGMTWGRYNYEIETEKISLAKLPVAFNGYKIVQLSDLHLGSYGKNYKGVARLVKEVNALNPDLIVFTGDMVNNFASEMTPWIPVLKKLKAKDGKYAVTGNHDYGDYTRWPSLEAKQANLKQFFKNMEAMGFHMLNNSHVPLVSGQDTIYLAGVENWGNPPFPRYGKLQTALKGLEDRLIILLSHDPSHWRNEVLKYPVAITLSGHTHAMQLGFRYGNKKWSPAQYIYPEYDGLYQHNNQYLYVCRGQGFLGFPGRIGLRPVITEIILNSLSNP